MPSLETLLEGYTRALRADKRQPRGVEKYLWTIGQVANWLMPASLLDLDAQLVQRYKEELADRELSASTIGNHLSVIRSFCRWAMDEELRSDDPTLRARWPSKPETAPRALGEAELGTLLAAIAQPLADDHETRWYWERNRRAILLLLYTGLRLAEMTALLWGDVDLAGRQLMVRCGKGGKDRMIPLHTQLVGELRGIPVERRKARAAVIAQEDGAALTYKSAPNIFAIWLPRYGIADMSAHRLRHTFATQLLAHGADIKAIQELLGHKRLDTTQRYLMLDDRQRRAAIERLPELAGMGKGRS